MFKYLMCVVVVATFCLFGGELMVSEGKGRLFRRKDGKYLIYVPKDLAEDTMFPYKCVDSVFVRISFKTGDNRLVVERWIEPRLPQS
jgi:hypothetical protein